VFVRTQITVGSPGQSCCQGCWGRPLTILPYVGICAYACVIFSYTHAHVPPPPQIPPHTHTHSHTHARMHVRKVDSLLRGSDLCMFTPHAVPYELPVPQRCPSSSACIWNTNHTRQPGAVGGGQDKIGEVNTASVACGVLGVGGNKGAVAVSFTLFRRKVAVICSHFAAHQV
jgi:hypothetical protein